MSIVDDLPSKTPPLSRVWRGKFHNTITEIWQMAVVVLPDLVPHNKRANDVVWKNCYWAPRVYPTPAEDKIRDVIGGMGGVVNFGDVPLANYLYPKKGDDCLCIFDNYRRLWVVTWWPK